MLRYTVHCVNTEITPFVYPFQQAESVAHHPKLRKKKVGKSVYWFTKAGGDTYFGNVEEVTHRQAGKLFADHLPRIRTDQEASKRRRLSVGDLRGLFLDWVQKHRDERPSSTRRTYCSRFGAFKV